MRLILSYLNTPNIYKNILKIMSYEKIGQRGLAAEVECLIDAPLDGCHWENPCTNNQKMVCDDNKILQKTGSINTGSINIDSINTDSEKETNTNEQSEIITKYCKNWSKYITFSNVVKAVGLMVGLKVLFGGNSTQGLRGTKNNPVKVKL